jgi:hypothetical protein
MEGLLTVKDFTSSAKDIAVLAKRGQKTLTDRPPLDRLRLAQSLIPVG